MPQQRGRGPAKSGPREALGRGRGRERGAWEEQRGQRAAREWAPQQGARGRVVQPRQRGQRRREGHGAVGTGRQSKVMAPLLCTEVALGSTCQHPAARGLATRPRIVTKAPMT